MDAHGYGGIQSSYGIGEGGAYGMMHAAPGKVSMQGGQQDMQTGWAPEQAHGRIRVQSQGAPHGSPRGTPHATQGKVVLQGAPHNPTTLHGGPQGSGESGTEAGTAVSSGTPSDGSACESVSTNL